MCFCIPFICQEGERKNDIWIGCWQDSTWVHSTNFFTSSSSSFVLGCNASTTQFICICISISVFCKKNIVPSKKSQTLLKGLVLPFCILSMGILHKHPWIYICICVVIIFHATLSARHKGVHLSVESIYGDRALNKGHWHMKPWMAAYTLPAGGYFLHIQYCTGVPAIY